MPNRLSTTDRYPNVTDDAINARVFASVYVSRHVCVFQLYGVPQDTRMKYHLIVHLLTHIVATSLSLAICHSIYHER